jgi:DNA-directed RNA polymerase subunit RPC12/RpoP
MADFVTLSCPSCGGKLEITDDVERFACAHCGREHIVKRSGGIVSLSPVVDAIRQVGIGVDKTAAELAIVRLKTEISELQRQKLALLEAHPRPVRNVNWLIVIPVVFLLVMCSIATSQSNTTNLVIFFSGIAIVIFVVWRLSVVHHRETVYWEETIGAELKSINNQIAEKNVELQYNQKVVSP